jgi:ATP-dependent Clp protease ATP-binding subunit ClpA
MNEESGPHPTPRYQQILRSAAEMATNQGHEYVGTEHLFLAILADPDAVPTQVLAELIEIPVLAARVRAVMSNY